MSDDKKIRLSAFTSRRFDQFAANPNGQRSDPTSLVVPTLQRLPFQPAMPAEHPAMNWFKQDPTRRGRDFLDQMLLTDAAFHKWSREQAISEDIKDKAFARWLTERQLAEKHAFKWVLEEDKRRFIFFQKAAHNRFVFNLNAASARLRDIDRTLRREYEAVQRRDVVNDHNEQLIRKMADRLHELSAHFTWSQTDLPATVTELAIERQVGVQTSSEEAANALRFAAQMALKDTFYALAPKTPESALPDRAFSQSTAKLIVKKVS